MLLGGSVGRREGEEGVRGEGVEGGGRKEGGKTGEGGRAWTEGSIEGGTLGGNLIIDTQRRGLTSSQETL